jgi:hypothetical protein
MSRISRKKTMRGAVISTLFLCMGVPLSWAWGREGHRLTALVAEQYLTPAAKEQVTLLLGKETMVEIAPWADAYREEHSETAKWHYVDIPGTEVKFDRNRDCPLSQTDPKSPWRDCVTDRILYFEGRLGDESLSTKERAIALKFLVHFMGDVHQPFHAMGDERGGNNISVSFLGSRICGSYKCNLHSVWDDTIIEDQRLNEKKYTEKLLQEIKDNQWERMAGGEPTTWANISHHYAVQAMAPNGAFLTRAYVTEESKIVDAQLALGGLRLARVLNRILAPPEAPAVQAAPTATPAATPQQPPQ